MPQINIGKIGQTDLFMEHLSHAAMDIVQAGSISSFEIRSIDGMNLIEFQFDAGLPSNESFSWCQKLSEILAETVLGLFDERLAREALHRYHDYLSPDDMARVSERLREHLLKEGVLLDSRRSERKSLVAARFLDALGEFPERLDLAGFVRFRLKEYQQEIQSVVSQIVNDYLMDKEHDEFIQLLRYFVDLQKPKTDWIQVLMSRDGFFRILDYDNRPIHAEYLDASINHRHPEINYDDLLISALITIAPAHLGIHAKSFTNQGIVKTICAVFEGRCTICDGCPLCE